MKNTPASKDEPEIIELQNKLFRIKPGASRTFDILKAEQGPRSGPRLIAEALDLLFIKYGKKPHGFP